MFKGQFQKCYGGVYYLDSAGPCAKNIERLDRISLEPMIEMERTGLQVNLSHFAKMKITLERDLEEITEKVQGMTGRYVNLGSSPQVSELLFKDLGLKQARPKLTASGDRESTDNEVLVAIQHDHPVVPLILIYRELDKLRGTYVEPIPKLAVRTKFGEWRLYPHFKNTRIPSGRYAAANPNILAMPSRTDRGREVKEGFIAQEGWSIVSCDECFHPQTKIKTLTGDRAIWQVQIGEAVLSYKEGRITWGRVTRRTSVRPKRAFRITFDNGESVISSQDHRWPVKTDRKRRGRYTEFVLKTEELKVGQRMIPCREGSGSAGHKTWYSRSAFEYDYQHVFVAEAFHGPRPIGYETHHRDENKHNNDPSNLEYLTKSDHDRLHSKETYAKQDHSYRLEKLREGIKERQTYKGTANPNNRIYTGGMEIIERMVLQDGATARDVATLFGLSYGYSRRLVKGIGTDLNHKIVSIEDIGIQPMWAITVEGDHSYILSCGVVTLNSQIEVRVAAHRSHDPNLIKIYENEEDIYSDFATAAFNLKDSRYQDDSGQWKYPTVDKQDHRFPAKTCVLASIYDVTEMGLVDQMPVICGNCGWISLPPSNKKYTDHSCRKFIPKWTENKCLDLINRFYIRYPGLQTMRKQDHHRMLQKAMVWDDWGRIQHIQAVRSVLPWVVTAALREGSNQPVQGTAQGTIKVTQAQLYNDWQVMGMQEVIHWLAQVHDELLWEIRNDVIEEWCAHAKYRFENCVRLRVPIKASTASAPSWGLLEK